MRDCRMRFLLLILLILANIPRLSAQFVDDFSDGNLSQNPAWSGDTSHFKLLQGQLALRAAAGVSRSQLTTSSNAQLNASFSGWVRLQFNPSSANYLDYYLISNSDSLHLPLDGLFLRFGHTPDEVSLYKQQGSTRTKVIDGPDGMLNYNDNQLRFEIKRDSAWVWTLRLDTSGLGQAWQNVGSWTDSTIYAANYSGLICIYSSTRADKFYFDDLNASGNSWQDQQPPRLISSTFLPPRTLRLIFDDSLDPATQATQFIRQINQQGAENISWEAINQLLVRFPAPLLADIDHEIRLIALSDTSGNTMADTSVWLNWHQPVFGEIIINELLADPSPAQLLPEAEFVELYNRSNFTLNLKNYRWQDSGTAVQLPDHNLVPGAFVLLCPLSALAQYMNYGPAVALTSWPALNNDSDRLRLSSEDGILIDSVHYQVGWLGSADKQAGGWSLERRDPNQFCLQRENWSAAVDANGGTPGQGNSIAAPVIDSLPPALSKYDLTTPDSLWLTFSKAVFNAGQATIRLNEDTLSFSPAQNDTGTTWLVRFPAGGLGNQTYTLSARGFRDCSGFTMADTQLMLAWPAWPEMGDWQVDELLFIAKSSNATFVELHNVSSKILNLKDISLANPTEAGGVNQVQLSGQNRLVLPGERLVATRNISGVKTDYPIHGNSFQELKSWPSMPQAGGDLGLYRSDGRELCRWKYHPDNHFKLLQQTRGVSLERINSTGDPIWHSAAVPPGATPGLPNSQQIRPKATQSEVFVLDKTRFSPNADGLEDDLGVCWTNQPEGGLLNIQIFSVTGKPLRQLANQQLMASAACLYWDGLDDSGRRCATGRYLIQISVFWLDGRQLQQRLLVVVDALDNFSP